VDVACHGVATRDVPDDVGIDERGQQRQVAGPERISRAAVGPCVRMLGAVHARNARLGEDRQDIS
jgi:hypothetical protein